MPRVKNSLLFIFFIILMDSIGTRIIFPVTASIISDVAHVSLNKAVTYNGWIMSSYAIVQLLFSPVLGSLSDRFGRRPVLLLSLAGSAVTYLFLSVATTLPLLFLGRIIGGICGASLTTSYAYIADISPPEKRAQNFGIMGTAIGVGFIIGPFIGGILSAYGTRIPFIAAGFLSLLNFMYVLFTIPESLKLNNRREFDIKRANLLRVFTQLKNGKAPRILLLVLFLSYLAGQTLPAIWPFYTKFLFNWSDLKIGYSLAFAGLLLAIVKGTLIRWTQKKVGSVYAVHIGLLFSMFGLSLFAVVCSPWMIYACMLVYCLGGIAPPMLQGIISGQMDENEQGELQGIIIALISLSTIISPLFMTFIFYFFTKKESSIYFPGAPFALAALIVFLGLLLYIRALKKEQLIRVA